MSIQTELLGKYFKRVDTHYVFRFDLRRAISLSRHDLIQDAPIPGLDLVMCRNYLMYFNAGVQARVLARLHFARHDIPLPSYPFTQIRGSSRATLQASFA
jgi:two-component system CheB/CheR fusion protein